MATGGTGLWLGPGAVRIGAAGAGVHRSLWSLLCRATDRLRVYQVPLAGLTPPGPGPLTEDACLDPRVVDDPAGFYPKPEPVRPDAWETLAERDGIEVEALAFGSAVPFGLAANDRVTVRFYRPARCRPRFALLILPGIWRQDRSFEHRLCRDLAGHGVSSALLTLPFHWERALPGEPSGAFFLTADPVWTSAAFRQAVVDARGVVELLRGRGMPVGVVGFSLGGILAHIVMSLEPVDLGVSVFAGGDTAGIVWESILTRAFRRAMEARGITREAWPGYGRPGTRPPTPPAAARLGWRWSARATTSWCRVASRRSCGRRSAGRPSGGCRPATSPDSASGG